MRCLLQCMGNSLDAVRRNASSWYDRACTILRPCAVCATAVCPDHQTPWEGRRVVAGIRGGFRSMKACLEVDSGWQQLATTHPERSAGSDLYASQVISRQCPPKPSPPTTLMTHVSIAYMPACSEHFAFENRSPSPKALTTSDTTHRSRSAILYALI